MIYCFYATAALNECSVDLDGKGAALGVRSQVVNFNRWGLRLKYTRGRFAFAALASITSITALIVVSISLGTTPWDVVLLIAGKLMGIDHEVIQPQTVDYVFLFGLYVSFHM